MKTFKYLNATTVDQAATALKAGNAAIIAGGTDILNQMFLGVKTTPYATLVNIKNIPNLTAITETSSGLEIGALAKLDDIANSAVVKSKYYALAAAAASVASPPIRAMGTIAGNLCQEVQCWYWRRPIVTGSTFNCLRKGGTVCFAATGDARYHAIFPAACFAVCPSDTAIALSALSATVVTNTRSFSIDSLFETLKTTLSQGEFITKITIPAPVAGTVQDYIKYSERPTIDFALVSVASAIVISGGTVSSSRIYLGGVAATPYRATSAEDAIKGKAISEALADTASATGVAKATPLASNKYKVQIAKGLIKKAILGQSL
jgi:xanthine dehydrogenase YagS FAD-binding subunit